jgi:predicted Rossmann-fold nucleotide-binding protein
VVQGLDFSNAEIDFGKLDVRGTVFLGCRFASPQVEHDLLLRGAIVFPRFEGLPYDPYRAALYSPEELMAGYQPGVLQATRDWAIHAHFVERGRHEADILEALAQRIHDHAIDGALRELLTPDRKVVAIMGGHGKRRDDPDYARAARLGWLLGRAGYFVASGGGPGVMEAANLGAYCARWPDARVVDDAIATLAVAPTFHDQGRFLPEYLDAARRVLDQLPEGAPSLAIPTWFYGHEPSNLFAEHVAKYFSNSVREDGLLAIALHGVVFAPGSAGTTQEIFMDATQNHYATFGYVSPMVFLGRDRYTKETHLWHTLRDLARGRAYADLMLLSDDPAEIVAFLQAHRPVASTG